MEVSNKKNVKFSENFIYTMMLSGWQSSYLYQKDTSFESYLNNRLF